jgi:hypothetical protein
LSSTITPAEFFSRFHGKDERIDLESLDLSTDLWEWVAREFVG